MSNAIRVFILGLYCIVNFDLWAVPSTGGRFTELPSGNVFVVVRGNDGSLEMNERLSLGGFGYNSWKGFRRYPGAILQSQPTALFDFGGRILVAGITREQQVVVYRETRGGSREFAQTLLPQKDINNFGIYPMIDQAPRLVRHRDGTLSLYAQAVTGDIYRARFLRDQVWTPYEWLYTPMQGARIGFTAGMGLGGEHYVFVSGVDSKLWYRAQSTEYGAWGDWQMLDDGYNAGGFTAGLEVINDRLGRLLLAHASGRTLTYRQMGTKPTSPWKGWVLGPNSPRIHRSGLVKLSNDAICVLEHPDDGRYIDRMCESEGTDEFSGPDSYLKGPFLGEVHYFTDYRGDSRSLGLDANGMMHETAADRDTGGHSIENWELGIFGGPFSGL